MGFNPFNGLLVKGGAVTCGTKTSVCSKTSRPPSNLTDFHRGEGSASPPVIFAHLGEGDMMRIKVEPHANRICGDKKVDLSALK